MRSLGNSNLFFACFFREKKMNFVVAFLLSFFLIPILGLILIYGSKRIDPIGCKHYGNTKNEVEFCAICHMNELGILRPAVTSIEDQLIE